jgi:hypothetical protein
VTRAARVAPVLVAVALSFAVLRETADADTLYELRKTKATLELGDSWQKTAVPGVVASFNHAAGSVLAVTRADVPNADAWRDEAKVKQAYADTLERGIRARIPGFKRVRKKLGNANGVPALDIEATRDTGATVIVRLLLFRTYALSLAIEVPPRGDIASARVIASKFVAPKS